MRGFHGASGWAVLLAGAVLTVSCGGAEHTPDLPAIEDARDARAADPCGVLTPAQLSEAGVSGSGAAVDATEGPRCEWGAGQDVRLGVTLFFTADGLETLAENSESTTTRVRVAGYPALETFTGEGEYCQYDVAVATDQAVLVSMDGGVPDSCSALQELVPQIVQNLPRPGS